MAQMAECEEQALVTANGRSENLVSVANLAACLQKNASEDRLVYYQLARALYQGVSATSLPDDAALSLYKSSLYFKFCLTFIICLSPTFATFSSAEVCMASSHLLHMHPRGMQ